MPAEPDNMVAGLYMMSRWKPLTGHGSVEFFVWSPRMNRSAHRRPRAIAIARTDNESRQLAFRLTVIAAGAVATLIALFY